MTCSSSWRTPRELLRVVPPPTVHRHCGQLCGTYPPIKAHAIIRRSGATLSADQAHQPHLSLWSGTPNGSRNESNFRESNSFCCWRPEKAGIRSKSAAPIATGEAAMIGAMLKQKGARGKTKPAVHFATDLAREGLCARIKLGASVLRPQRRPNAPGATQTAACRSPPTISERRSDGAGHRGRARLLRRSDRALAAVLVTRGHERILDRRRRVVAFAPRARSSPLCAGKGTIMARSCRVSTSSGRAMAGEGINTLPGVTPGGEILLRPRWLAAGEARPSTPLPISEARGHRPPQRSAPDWWRHLHNRIICNMSHPGLQRAVSMQPGSAVADW